MNAEKLRETLDRRLWGLFVELLLLVSEILGADHDELFEKILTDPKAEKVIIPMCTAIMGKEDS